ncbi:MAG: homoserine dehydrogenase [Mogibacterium sp.]|nr:homoserine dehydrogenase [Mogibacterium sp.]
MKVALMGFGTVGSGCYEALKAADGIDVKSILELRDLPEEVEPLHVRDIRDILEDSEIDVVAECMGGFQPAMDFMVQAMQHGKHVVTPNKALVSKYYDDLMDCAAENGVEFRFTPAAGGGIPWLYNLQRQTRCDFITELYGIVNGTCNFILDKMHDEGADFDTVLKEAQGLGYAERDPSADIKGFDTLRKCVISSNLAYSTRIHEDNVPVLGIDRIKAEDVRFFTENGYVCRLLMNSGVTGNKVYAYVEPALVRSDALEANVKQNYNLITLTGQNVGTLSFYGQGAGKMPTGTSLAQDIIDIKEGIGFARAAASGAVLPEVDNSGVCHRYYFRACEECLPELREYAESVTEQDGWYYVITKPVTVEFAHSFANAHPKAFAAGIRE